VNLIILNDKDMQKDGTALLTGRRYMHLREILGKQSGESIKAGMLGGKKGGAHIISLTNSEARLAPEFSENPPVKIPLTLVIAMQRPKTLKKILHCAAAMGVARICIIRTWRTEKSYFSNRIITPQGLAEELILGLEQAGDTVMPSVEIRKRFRPFVEDELPGIAHGSLMLTAHPYTDEQIPHAVQIPVTLAIGPEGGFIPFEIELLERIGFKTVSMGERTLRTEQALPAIIGKLF
jgi:16S rRNA (uracil1498-N3)-methyltransferase